MDVDMGISVSGEKVGRRYGAYVLKVVFMRQWVTQ